MGRTRSPEMKGFADWLRSVRGLSATSVNCYISRINTIRRLLGPEPSAEQVSAFIENAGTLRHDYATTWRAYAAYAASAEQKVPHLVGEEPTGGPNIPEEVVQALSVLVHGVEGKTDPMRPDVLVSLRVECLRPLFPSMGARAVEANREEVLVDETALQTVLAWSGNAGTPGGWVVPKFSRSHQPMNAGTLAALVKNVQVLNAAAENHGEFAGFFRWCIQRRGMKASVAASHAGQMADLQQSVLTLTPASIAAYAKTNPEHGASVYHAVAAYRAYAKANAIAPVSPPSALRDAVSLFVFGSADGEVEGIGIERLVALTRGQASRMPARFSAAQGTILRWAQHADVPGLTFLPAHPGDLEPMSEEAVKALLE